MASEKAAGAPLKVKLPGRSIATMLQLFLTKYSEEADQIPSRLFWDFSLKIGGQHSRGGLNQVRFKVRTEKRHQLG